MLKIQPSEPKRPYENPKRNENNGSSEGCFLDASGGYTVYKRKKSENREGRLHSLFQEPGVKYQREQ